MMNKILIVMLSGMLGLVGCGDGNGEGESGSTSGGSTASGTPASATTTAGGSKASDRKGDLSSEDFDRATADGTLGMFVAYMQGGEFQEAAMLTDPESEGYKELLGAVEALENAQGKADQGITLDSLMRAMMTRAWHGAVWESVTEQDDRARFDLKLVGAEPEVMDLVRIDGDWYLLAPKGIVKMANIDDLLPKKNPSGAEREAAARKAAEESGGK